MVHFELVNEEALPTAGKARKSRADDWSVWAESVVRYQCERAGIEMPTIKHRKVRARVAKEIIWALDINGAYRDSEGRRYRKVSVQKTMFDRASSSGICRYGKGEIQVNRGTDFLDYRYTVLHELAHWLCGPFTGHSVGFWRKCYELCREYELDMSHVYTRARNYKKRTATAAMPAGRE